MEHFSIFMLLYNKGIVALRQDMAERLADLLFFAQRCFNQIENYL